LAWKGEAGRGLAWTGTDWLGLARNGKVKKGFFNTNKQKTHKETESEQTNMKLVNVEIKGCTPLLQNRFTEDSEQSASTRKVLVDRGTPREQAQKAVYQDKEKKFYFPSTWVTRMLREVAANHKLRGTRRSAKYIIPAAVFVPHDTIPLTNGNGAAPKDFEVDSRPVTIPATKGRIMRHRPRFDEWGAKFSIRINETILPVDFIHQLMDEGGLQNGLGDFRPEKGGPFGTFQCTMWQETEK
jgi:hypothetical protein